MTIAGKHQYENRTEEFLIPSNVESKQMGCFEELQRDLVSLSTASKVSGIDYFGTYLEIQESCSHNYSQNPLKEILDPILGLLSPLYLYASTTTVDRCTLQQFVWKQTGYIIPHVCHSINVRWYIDPKKMPNNSI